MAELNRQQVIITSKGISVLELSQLVKARIRARRLGRGSDADGDAGWSGGGARRRLWRKNRVQRQSRLPGR